MDTVVEYNCNMDPGPVSFFFFFSISFGGGVPIYKMEPYPKVFCSFFFFPCDPKVFYS